VQRTYQEALAELQKRGVLTAEQANNAARMSNLDDMFKQQAGASDTKLLKLVAFAMVLRTMPEEKAVPIIQRFSPEDAQILQEYLLMDDLESELDGAVIFQCLANFDEYLDKMGNKEYYSKKFSDLSIEDFDELYLSKINEWLSKEQVCDRNVFFNILSLYKNKKIIKLFLLGSMIKNLSDKQQNLILRMFSNKDKLVLLEVLKLPFRETASFESMVRAVLIGFYILLNPFGGKKIEFYDVYNYCVEFISESTEKSFFKNLRLFFLLWFYMNEDKLIICLIILLVIKYKDFAIF
ncbi:hypothetical protein IJE86_09900, partial [bacterium]|nr:hypothetical protein [bacterium]